MLLSGGGDPLFSREDILCLDSPQFCFYFLFCFVLYFVLVFNVIVWWWRPSFLERRYPVPGLSSILFLFFVLFCFVFCFSIQCYCLVVATFFSREKISCAWTLLNFV